MHALWEGQCAKYVTLGIYAHVGMVFRRRRLEAASWHNVGTLLATLCFPLLWHFSFACSTALCTELGCPMSGLAQKGNQGKFSTVNRVYSDRHLYTSDRIQLMPNLGQPVTEAAVRGRGGGACKNSRCGRIDTRMLRGSSRQEGGGRRHLQDPVRAHYLWPGSPVPGGPIEFREQADEKDSKIRQSGRPSRDAGGVFCSDPRQCAGTDVEVALQVRCALGSFWSVPDSGWPAMCMHYQSRMWPRCKMPFQLLSSSFFLSFFLGCWKQSLSCHQNHNLSSFVIISKAPN